MCSVALIVSSYRSFVNFVCLSLLCVYLYSILALILLYITSARCDFPGGSSSSLYTSIKRLYDELPDDTRVYVGHDYQPGGRELLFQTTIGEEKISNKQLKGDTTEDEFATWRSERDGQLGMPKLLLPSIQVNLRGGEFPKAESNGVSYLKIPINLVGK